MSFNASEQKQVLKRSWIFITLNPNQYYLRKKAKHANSCIGLLTGWLAGKPAEGPRRPSKGPQKAPGDPKDAPGSPKRCPESSTRPQEPESPRNLQEASGAPGNPRRPSEDHQKPQEAPRRLPKGHRRRPEGP